MLVSRAVLRGFDSILGVVADLIAVVLLRCVCQGRMAREGGNLGVGLRFQEPVLTTIECYRYTWCCQRWEMETESHYVVDKGFCGSVCVWKSGVFHQKTRTIHVVARAL